MVKSHKKKERRVSEKDERGAQRKVNREKREKVTVKGTMRMEKWLRVKKKDREESK